MWRWWAATPAGRVDSWPVDAPKTTSGIMIITAGDGWPVCWAVLMPLLESCWFLFYGRGGGAA